MEGQDIKIATKLSVAIPCELYAEMTEAGVCVFISFPNTCQI